MPAWRARPTPLPFSSNRSFLRLSAATLGIKNPYHAFSRALGFFYQPPPYPPGIHATAVIDPTAQIGEERISAPTSSSVRT